MAEGTGDYQEEVLSGLLELQAELRGEEPPETQRVVEPPAPAGSRAEGSVTVSESGLQVTVAPTGAAVAERLAALNERLSRLERDLERVTDRVDGARGGTAAGSDQPAEDPDADAPWRSFLDLQRIVADRLDRE
jgi:hypothetical protein